MKGPNWKIVGDNFRHLRERRGVTRAWLAAFICVPVEEIDKLESEEVWDIDVSIFARACHALRVDADTMIWMKITPQEDK